MKYYLLVAVIIIAVVAALEQFVWHSSLKWYGTSWIVLALMIAAFVREMRRKPE